MYKVNPSKKEESSPNDKFMGKKRKGSKLGRNISNDKKEGKESKLSVKNLNDSEINSPEENLSNKNSVSKSKSGNLKLNKNKIERKPKQLCQYFVNGACNKGKECGFSHDVQIKKKNEICKYFLSGSCMKGDDCMFSHDTTQITCKYFHACGYCVNGDFCKFSHQRLNEDEVYKFIEQNEEFMLQLYKTAGKTNMDEFLNKYVEEKKKVPFNEYVSNLSTVSSVMLPQSMQPNASNASVAPKAINPMNPMNTMNPMNLNMNMNQMNPMNMMNNPNVNMQQFPFPGMFPPQMGQMQMNPHITANMNPNINPNIRPNFPMMPSQPPTNMQAFQMLMKNPMFLQFMRNPQMTQMMNTQNLNQERNEVIFNANTTDKSVNISSFVNKINPFEKPKSSSVPINTTPQTLVNKEVKEAKEVIKNEEVNHEENIIREEDEEEEGFFLKKLTANKTTTAANKVTSFPNMMFSNISNTTTGNTSNNISTSTVNTFNSLPPVISPHQIPKEIPKDPRVKKGKK